MVTTLQIEHQTKHVEDPLFVSSKIKYYITTPNICYIYW